jgi:chromosome segregation ATPase
MMSSSRGDDTRLAITAVRDAVAVLRLLSDPQGVRALTEQLQAAYDSTIAGINAAENHLTQRQEEIKALEAELTEKEIAYNNRENELLAAENELTHQREAFAATIKTQTDELNSQREEHLQSVAEFKSQMAQREAKFLERETDIDKRDVELLGKAQALDKRDEDLTRQAANQRIMQVKFNEWETRLQSREQELATYERDLSARELAHEQRVKRLHGMLAEAEGGEGE